LVVDALPIPGRGPVSAPGSETGKGSRSGRGTGNGLRNGAKNGLRRAEGSFWRWPKISWVRLAKRTMVILGTIALVLILSALMIVGYIKLTNSDFFLVRPETINVTGLRRVTRGEALKAAGLDRPRNLLSIDASASMAALRSLPWVESAELTRYVPDGVSVAVTEYEPKALASLDNLYYIDGLGRPFKRLDPGENPNLSIVSGFEIDDLLSGGPLVLEGLGEVLRLMGLLAERGDEFRLANISEIHYDPDRGVTLFTLGGELEIKVGSGAFAEKLIRLGRVAAYLKLDDRLGDLEYLNLDCPPRVTGRFKKGRGRNARESTVAESRS
jgi:cell division protein FtsQ